MDKMVNGSLVKMTDEEIAEFNARQNQNDWLHNRVVSYPPIPEQLDKIYHEGLDAWKSDIKAIKDAYPKP
jgi:hypothetical protein